MVTAGGNNFPDAAAGIGYITAVTGDDVGMKMKDSLPGIGTDV